MSKIIKKVCQYCKENKLWFDAVGVWSEEDQEFVMESCNETKAYCNVCDGETTSVDIVMGEIDDNYKSELNHKALKHLHNTGYSARIDNNTVYLIVEDREFELAEDEIAYQAKEFDKIDNEE